MFLVSAKEMQEMDRLTIDSYGIPGMVLMENAGRGAIQFLLEKFPEIYKQKVGVVAGGGNNGGDGFVMARYLSEKGIKTTVYLLSSKSRIKGDAEVNLNLLRPLDVSVIEMTDVDAFSDNRSSLVHQDLFIDAILGTGLNSDVKGFFKEIIEFINNLNKPVFSVDIPSGLNSDTGQPCGISIKATATATFGFAKTGHFLFPGSDYTGDLEIIDIGIPFHIRDIVSPSHYLLTRKMIRRCLQPRSSNAHKGSTGHLLIIGGSPGKTGAAAMTAMSAMRSGAGLVTLGIPNSLNPVFEALSLESMTSVLPETKEGLVSDSAFDSVVTLFSGKKCLAVGPGMGTGNQTKNLICKLIPKSDIPIVIDADGLNNLVGNTHVLKTANAPVVLTPHPGEMARLIDSTPQLVQKNRLKVARDFAMAFNVHLVLKGAGTIIAHPDGRVFINSTGNPGMASGGMGDVLTGVIAGLIVQGYSPELAAQAGVYFHGAAADTLALRNTPLGYLASEVADAIPQEIGKVMRN